MVNLAAYNFQTPSNIFMLVKCNGLLPALEQLFIQLLDASLVCAQGTFHIRNPSIQGNHKVFGVPAGISSNYHTPHSAGCGNCFIGSGVGMRPGIWQKQSEKGVSPVRAKLNRSGKSKNYLQEQNPLGEGRCGKGQH